MNKKLIGNLFLIALVIALGLSFIDFGTKAKTDKAVISDYIADNLEKETRYRPIRFKRIDEKFLLEKKEVQEAYATVVDSIARQLELLANEYISLDFQNRWKTANSHAQRMNLESIYHYLPLDAAMKRALKNYELSDDLKEALYKEETRMHQGINALNAALGKYNLSLFNLQLDNSNNPHYWHRYELTDDEGSSQFDAVFELEKNSREIVSFKEIVSVG